MKRERERRETSLLIKYSVYVSILYIRYYIIKRDTEYLSRILIRGGVIKKKYRYAIQLPDGRWVSLTAGMLYSRNGVGKNKQSPPDSYTSTNIFKVLRIRRRVLNGEVIHEWNKGVMKKRYYTECRCMRV